MCNPRADLPYHLKQHPLAAPGIVPPLGSVLEDVVEWQERQPFEDSELGMTHRQQFDEVVPDKSNSVLFGSKGGLTPESEYYCWA